MNDRAVAYLVFGAILAMNFAMAVYFVYLLIRLVYYVFRAFRDHADHKAWLRREAVRIVMDG